MMIPKPPPRQRLRPGQHMRHPIRKLGKVGRANIAFSKAVLKRWFDEELSRGQRPRVDSAGWEIVTRHMRAMPSENATGRIMRRVGLGGIIHFKSPDGEVGHKEGAGKDRRPDLRVDFNAVEFQSKAFNRYMETITQGQYEEDKDE